VSAVRRVSLLGSTGSIGESALDVVRASGGRLGVAALAAGSNWRRLAAQAREFRPALAVLADAGGAGELARELAGTGVAVAAGAEGLLRAAALDEAEVVLSAIVGAAGILPTLAAARAGKTVALANKESLVAAGGVITAAIAASGGTLLPVDSEHSALFQLLAGRPAAEVRAIVLTASGGPFFARAGSLDAVTPEDALRHPSWTMGAKVTIDSATLMNKGLEVIEAHWLFGLPLERIEVVVHPQSVVHGAVELVDGALLAHLSPPDMRIPIAAALYHPERVALPWRRLDLAQLGRLEFFAPDRERFPALPLAYAAFARGGVAPAVLNAANEVAVQAFLERRLGFTAIVAVVERVLGLVGGPAQAPDIESIMAADAAARDAARAVVAEFAANRRG
jgi:1-deoxy-D-xylulose-5-phosphate reductoisomerase